MIKCNIKLGSKLRVAAGGTGTDIVVETLTLIQHVYLGIKEQNPEVAEQYKAIVIESLLDPNSPFWR